MNTAVFLMLVIFAVLGFTGGWMWPIIAVVGGVISLFSMAILDGSGRPADFEVGLVLGVFGGGAASIYAFCVAIYTASLALMGVG